MNSIVCYSSRTGNTKKLAEHIFSIIPFEKKILPLSGTTNSTFVDNDLIFFGYWVENNKPDADSLKIMQTLEQKKIVLFASLGSEPNEAYINKLKLETENYLHSSNSVLGHFICRGQISDNLVARFERLSNSLPDNKFISEMLLVFKENYPKSLQHPDKKDLKNLSDFIFNLLQNIQTNI